MTGAGCRMNIIRMTGGLGNQMFQYALYLKLKSMGKDVKLDDITEYEGQNARPIMLWAFGIDYPKASREEINKITDGILKTSHRIRRKLFGRKSLEYHEKDCNFDEEILTREPAYLTGYFQSEKYFKDIEGQVRIAFQFSDEIWKDLDTVLLERLQSYQKQIEKTIAVSLHIRRGDYLENTEAYGGICTEEYYKKAIELVKKKEPEAVFYVFSNETDWAKEWIDIQYKEMADRFVVIEGTTEETGYLDLFLMSRCKHHIMANSSFSWWGAWLNPSKKKLVIAPSKWFGNQNCVDIYTEEMVQI